MRESGEHLLSLFFDVLKKNFLSWMRCQATRLRKLVKCWVGKALKCEKEPAKIKEIEDKHKENGGIYNGKWKVFTAWRT